MIVAGINCKVTQLFLFFQSSCKILRLYAELQYLAALQKLVKYV